MFTVSEGNTVKHMEDIFWKTEKNVIHALSQKYTLHNENKGKNFWISPQLADSGHFR